MARCEGEHRVELTVPGRTDYEPVVRATAVAVAQRLGLGQRQADALVTALGEAYRNAVEHGHRGDGSLPVAIRFRIRPAGVVVDVVDHGPGFSEPEPPDLDAQIEGRQARRGWGLTLMRELMDEVSFHAGEQGDHITRLHLFKAPAPGREGGRD